MDALLSSIDIHSLLPTSSLSPTSPLSAPDLRLLIDRLHTRSLLIKSQILSYVTAHHSDFHSLFSRSSLAADSTAVLASALDALLTSPSADVTITSIVNQIRTTILELEFQKQALSVVETIASLTERVNSVREDLGSGRLVEAAREVSVLKAEIPVEEAGEPDVYILLRTEWTECFEKLQEVLRMHAESCVQFEPESGRLTVRRSSELRTALEAMEVAGVMDYGLGTVADLIVKDLITSVIVDASMNVCVERQGDTVENSVAVLSLLPLSESQENLGGAIIYEIVIQVIEFIFEFICCKNHRWVQCFGRLSWKGISELIEKHFLSKVVADVQSPGAPFQHIIDITSAFESSLKEMMFIPKTDSSEERLSKFIHDAEVNFASGKRNEILAKARSVLLQFDLAISLESSPSEAAIVGEDLPKNAVNLLFQPERCYISKAASQLMEIVHATLKDVCISSTRVAKEFYHAARDALLLYKAIIPIKLMKKLDSISQEAIVIHNDCYYLSQEILALSFEYRTDFPSGLKEYAVFADIAPKFYVTSTIILEKQVQLVVNRLREVIDEADGFQNTHQPQQYESAKFCIDQVVSILMGIRTMWEPLMPPSTYSDCACTLLDSVFSRITKDMLFLDDIAAEETLERLIHILLDLEHLSSFFESLLVDAYEKEQFSNNCYWGRLDELIPSLGKLRKLADLFDMPLKSITTTWESGELSKCGFTSSEVGSFIKAIFADSPLRKECIWRIESVPS